LNHPFIINAFLHLPGFAVIPTASGIKGRTIQTGGYTAGAIARKTTGTANTANAIRTCGNAIAWLWTALSNRSAIRYAIKLTRIILHMITLNAVCHLTNAVIAHKAGAIGNLIRVTNIASAVLEIVTKTGRMITVIMESGITRKCAFTCFTTIIRIRNFARIIMFTAVRHTVTFTCLAKFMETTIARKRAAT
jgi:hypothetical protein